jgi:glycosyltransferase involved in cell wall biosynthesis
MACAKPIVAYDIGWAPELIASGVNGLLVPAGDSQAFSKALVAILADWKGGHELGLASRQRVEVQFSAGVVARQALAWYQGVR